MVDLAKQLREMADVKASVLYSKRKTLNEAADLIDRLNADAEKTKRLLMVASRGWSSIAQDYMMEGHIAVARRMQFAADELAAFCNGDRKLKDIDSHHVAPVGRFHFTRYHAIGLLIGLALCVNGFYVVFLRG